MRHHWRPATCDLSSYPGTHWEWVLTLKPDQEAKNYSQFDERTDNTFEAIMVAEGMVKPIVRLCSGSALVCRKKFESWRAPTPKLHSTGSHSGCSRKIRVHQ